MTIIIPWPCYRCVRLPCARLEPEARSGGRGRAASFATRRTDRGERAQRGAARFARAAARRVLPFLGSSFYAPASSQCLASPRSPWTCLARRRGCWVSQDPRTALARVSKTLAARAGITARTGPRRRAMTNVGAALAPSNGNAAARALTRAGPQYRKPSTERRGLYSFLIIARRRYVPVPNRLSAIRRRTRRE